MSIKPTTEDTGAAQAHRTHPRGERQRGAREAADFERALHTAGKALRPDIDEEDRSPAHGLLEPMPVADLARTTAPATVMPRRPPAALGSEESRQEVAATGTIGTVLRDAQPAPHADEPARGMLPSTAMQDALRAASLPPTSSTKASSLRIEMTDARAPLQHIALQRSPTGALDVQLGADTRLRAPLAASTDRLRARLAERGASLASVALEATDTPDDTTR